MPEKPDLLSALAQQRRLKKNLRFLEDNGVINETGCQEYLYTALVHNATNNLLKEWMELAGKPLPGKIISLIEGLEAVLLSPSGKLGVQPQAGEGCISFREVASRLKRGYEEAKRVATEMEPAYAEAATNYVSSAARVVSHTFEATQEWKRVQRIMEIQDIIPRNKGFERP